MSHVHATPVSHLTDPGSHGAGPEIDLDAALSELRAASPLVQCLTNIVAANFTANVLLSAGAIPAMVDNSREARLFAGAANVVLVNTGTPYPDTAQAMTEAASGASSAGHPWVLDPVAASLPWRGQIALDTLRAANPTIIRGNASEILALAGEASGGRGPDSTDEAHAALASAQQLAAEHHCVVAVSGPIDLITDGKRVVSAANGHPWMTKVTAVGCALGALMAAFAAVCEPLDAAVAATSLLCVAAERAAAESRAPGSFAVALLDQLSLVSPAELAAAAKVHDVEA
ncbi:hydroxyethylthiazole kinase [Propionibacterium cyclohexanicum]|uniref:Hydroxyethylthiazole kinase n=2 Tax=Propionibacterium cyclohexanicum TaxID=64702 RepID=A0A1H9RVS6_9ACTN|nr:hydroxyethylthiazole kinase [Propionibacterium cyclohexanicum]SER76253.1 hydroxyethylthiazole kinase [Propionibacterium cyclohexanicum]